MKKLKIVLLSVSILLASCSRLNQQEQICTVTDKESVRKNDGNQYRVYTDCGTFAVEDSLVLFRFDSADLYGGIERNKKYKFHTGSYRIGLFSMFPNIISYTEVKNDRNN